MSLSVAHYTVFGHPVAHSKSPLIHRLFAQQTAQRLEYTATLAPLTGFVSSVQQFYAEGGQGCNVTVPFKQEAWHLSTWRSPYAERARAVNTLKRQADGWYGDNTDGVGLLRDLQSNQGLVLQGARILLLGAGGAARGVLQPLLEAQPAELWIANRTASTALELAADFAEFGCLGGGGFNHIEGEFDLIINATSASLQGTLPPLAPHCLRAGGSCYDMMYAATPTPFLVWAQEQGAHKALDGLGMLVEQAAAAFELWRGVRPDTAAVLQYLRTELSAS